MLWERVCVYVRAAAVVIVGVAVVVVWTPYMQLHKLQGEPLTSVVKESTHDRSNRLGSSQVITLEVSQHGIAYCTCNKDREVKL